MLSSIFKFLFALGLVLMPLIFWPQAKIPYEIPRVWFIQRWIEILAILGLIAILKQPKKHRIDTWLLVLIIGFFLTALVASLFGINWLKSFWGNYYRGDGLITLAHLIVFWLVMLLVYEPNWRNLTIKAVSFGALITSSWAVWVGLNKPGAVGVSFGQPVFLAGYLTVCLPFLAYLIIRAKKKTGKWFWGLGLILTVLAIGLTRAWGGILGIAVFIIGWPIAMKAKANWLISFTGLILLMLVAGVIWQKENYLKSGNWAMVAEARERIIVKGFLGWQKRPILGWGWANFDSAFQTVDWPEKYKVDVYVDKAHSSFLEILTTTGIIGLGFYILLIVRTLKVLKQPYLLLVLILWLVHSQTNVISIAEELVFWLIMGIAAKT